MENTKDALIESILKNKPIKGLLLGVALEIIHKSYGGGDKKFLDELKEKIMSGKELTDYEMHIFVDVLMVHRSLDEEENTIYSDKWQRDRN